MDDTIWINAENNYWGTNDSTEIAAGINGQIDYDPYESTEIEEAGPG